MERVAKLYRLDMPLNDIELLYIYLVERGLIDGELAAILSPVTESEDFFARLCISV